MSSYAVTELETNVPKVINAETHGFIDYAHATFFLGMSLVFRKSNPRASVASLLTGGFVLVQSLLTDYPLGVWPVLPFKAHGQMDAGFAAASAIMPEIFGFSGTPAAALFRGNAAVESSVVAMTNWDSAEARTERRLLRSDATQHISIKREKLTLAKLIDLLRDSHQGFVEFGAKLQDPEARELFRQQTTLRANYAGELETMLHRLGVKDVHQSGMVSGKLHRAWGNLKSKLGAGDHDILATAEQGEDTIKRFYGLALQEDLPSYAREVLEHQQRHLLEAHDRVKQLRDRSARSVAA